MDIKLKGKYLSGLEVAVGEPCRLDLDNAVEYGTTIKDYVEDHSINEVVLDFTNILFISSFGLKVIMEIYKALQQPPSIKITNASETIKKAFKMVGFDTFIEIE